MDGAAGPLSLDTAAWKWLLTSFKSASTKLCDAFVACRLIALDKCPGLHHIGIGETVQRIISIAIAITITEDFQEACGPLQVCQVI